MDFNCIWFHLLGFGVFLINPSNLDEKIERKNSDLKIESYLQGDKRSKLIMSFPYHNFCLYRIMLNTKHKVIMPLHMKESSRNQFKNKFETRYAYLDLNKIKEISSITSLNTLILDKKVLVAEGFDNWAAPEGWKKIELDQNTYDVYELE